MLELTGQTIDRFQIAARLSDEWWGSVWKAYDQKFDRTVALLTLDPIWAVQNHQGEYVLNTARTTLRFRHPGVARILDIGQAGDLGYIVQEYVPGHDLSTILKNQRERKIRLPIPEAVQIIVEICRALDYIHQRSLVHGNISPASILFKDEASEELHYQPVLAYLGFVNPEKPDSSPEPPYRAPEIERTGQISPAADIFSAGVLLYELLTGVRPESYPFPRPSSLRPEIPDGLEKMLRRALTPDPANRFSDAGRMAAALEGVLPILVTAFSGGNASEEGDGSLVESLHTALQIGWQDPIFASISPSPISSISDTQPAAPQADLSQDLVHIQEPGRDARSIHMQPGPMVIGRSQSNDIIVDAPGISRRHARIEFDGQNYRLIDLNSTNGTYLDDTALVPGEPTKWPAGGTVRIGEVFLRLERASQSQTTRAFIADATRPAQPMPQTVPVVTASNGRSLEMNQVILSADKSIGAYTENPNLVAKPGSSLSMAITVFNRSAAADTVNIAYEGLPVEWMANPPHTISLPANSDRELNLTFRPPRSSSGRAGRHQLIVQITSLRSPAQAVELRLSLTVTAFSEFFSELQTNQIRRSQVGQVLIHNRGNLPETFMVLWEDRLRELTFDPPQVRVTIPPGKSAAVEYRPQVMQPRWFGSDTSHRYKVHVSAQTGEMQTHSGEYIARALVPAWAPIALLTICVGLICLVMLLANEITAPAVAVRQTRDSSTETVGAGTRSIEAVTLTADAVNKSIRATQVAVTLTAESGNTDRDGDRLSAVQEALYNTSVDNPDTDNDHLRDGEEVLDYHTNPLVPDSDGDLIKDGEEVRIGSDPLKKDTDGDGIDDSFDPDPIRHPTATIVILPTFTRPPTATSTTAVLFTDLAISITNGRDLSTPGQGISYRIEVTNRGQAEVRDIAVTAALPAGLINANWVCTPGLYSRCTTENGSGNVNARVNLIANGSAIITLNGTVSATAANQLAVTANVAPPPGPIDTNLVNNQATDLDTLSPQINLTLTKTDNRDSVRGGEVSTYIITVRNSGPSSITGVSLIDAFPAELTNVTWSCAASAGSSCSTSGPVPGNVNTLLNLAANGTATVTANATVRQTASGTITNTASVTSPIDPLANNKTAVDTTQVELQADLGVSVTAPLTVTVNSILTYTLSLRNDGPAAASALELATQLPPDAAFITYTLSSPVPSPICNAASGRIYCALGPLPAGGMLQINVVIITQSTPGQIETYWDILAPELDPNEVNNRANNIVLVY